MLFNQEEFEHKIAEQNLKKGLKLLDKNKIEFISKGENSVFTFLIHERSSAGNISIQIKAAKILKYDCFCGNKNYCEHLAAGIFYLQQEKLQLKEIKNNKRSVRAKNKKSLFERYSTKIKIIISPFVGLAKLRKDQLLEINKKIGFEKAGAETFKEVFYFNLAIICELSKFSQPVVFEKDNIINNIFKNSLNQVAAQYNKGLTAIEKEGFLAATHYTLRSQANFKPAAFTFFIARAVIFINDKSVFENLKAQLKKRRQNKNSLDPINRKLIAELQIAIMEAKLAGKVYSLKKYGLAIEVPIALAELEFHSKKMVKGFAVLEQYGDKVKAANKHKYLDLIDEIIKLAIEQENKKAESNYLAEKFIQGFFIGESELKRFLELNSDVSAATNLLKQIKNESVFYTFEKTATILLDQGRLDELIEEIKKEKNKFKLLHKIAIQKLPVNDKEFIKLYVHHLSQALTEAKFPYFQELVFNTAKLFLDKLPIELSQSAIDILQKKMMYDKHIIRYIGRIYSGLA